MEGQPLTPKNVDLLTLHQFMGEVIDLLQGDAKRAEIGQPSVAIEDGSVKLVSIVTPLLAAAFQADIRSGQMRDLRLIDVVRPLKEIDEDKRKTLWRKGRNAWAEITSPTEWVERLRES
jgi:hypothetical protein